MKKLLLIILILSSIISYCFATSESTENQHNSMVAIGYDTILGLTGDFGYVHNHDWFPNSIYGCVGEKGNRILLGLGGFYFNFDDLITGLIFGTGITWQEQKSFATFEWGFFSNNLKKYYLNHGVKMNFMVNDEKFYVGIGVLFNFTFITNDLDKVLNYSNKKKLDKN